MFQNLKRNGIIKKYENVLRQKNEEIVILTQAVEESGRALEICVGEGKIESTPEMLELAIRLLEQVKRNCIKLTVQTN